MKMVVAGLFGMFALWGGLQEPRDDSPRLESFGVVFLAGVILAGLVPMYRVAVRRRVRRSGGIKTRSLGGRPTGMLLPYARGLTFFSWVSAGVGMIVGLVMIFVIAPAPDEGYREVAAAPLGLCVVLASLWWAVRLLLRGWRRRGLLLDPEGVLFFGTRDRRFARWDEIVDISPSMGDGALLSHGIQIRLMGMATGSDGTALIDNSSGPDRWLIQKVFLEADPVLINQLLNFYLDNPAARAELRGPAAIARLKKADVPTYVQPSIIAAERSRRSIEERWERARPCLLSHTPATVCSCSRS